MRPLVVTVEMFFIASPALADPPPQAALDLITAANAQGVFEAAPSEPGAIVVRHPRSGLLYRKRYTDHRGAA